MALLNFKYGAQADLKSTFAAGTVYITSDTKKLFIDNPHGSSGRICLGDFQLVSWTKSADVTSPAAALASYSLKDTNTLYITVESEEGATAMWRYNGTTFVAISNSEEIADILADIAAIKTALNGKAPTSHAVNANTYGLGTSGVYGHVKLSDSTSSSTAAASGGTAATPKAVKAAYDRGSLGVTNAATAQAAAEAADAKAVAAQGTADAAVTAAEKAQGEVDALELVVDGKAPTNHASADTTYGAASTTAYGHVKLSDAINSTSTSLGATANAVKKAYDRGSAGVTAAGTAQTAAENAATAAQNAQSKADEAYTLAGKKTTTAEVKAQIEAYGYATTAVAQDKADAALASAKSYTDGKITTVNTTIDTLKSDIGNLSNIMNFLGTTTTEIADGTTKTINKPSAVTDTTYTAKTGDVVVDSKGKECVFDGTVWRVIGDTSANSTAITALQGRMTTAEGEIDALQADVGTDDGKGTLFARVSALETWKSTHSTEYTNLNTAVTSNTTAINNLTTVLTWGTFA